MEIKLRDVSFSYKKVNYKENEILKEINITVKKGNVTTIIGNNGSGKTTLLELINRELLPTKGTIKIDGSTPSEESLNKIAYIPQEIEFVTKTVLEELEYAMISHNYKPKNIEKRLFDVLIMVKLDPTSLEKKISQLTNSERKKLSLATALIYNPKVLILDDITQDLDNKNKDNILKLIRMLKNRYKKTILIATNDIEFIHKIADYIYVLDNKQIVLEGDKYTLFKQVDKLNKIGVSIPNTMKFSNLVLTKKNIKIGYRDEINDLIKDIYRYVK